MVNFIFSVAVNTTEVNCLRVMGESMETALKLLSKPVKVQVPVEGITGFDIDLMPFMLPFFALTPNQYKAVLVNPCTK